MAAMIRNLSALNKIPVIANCDFGHTTPILTLPIGGRCRLRVGGGDCRITIETH